MDNFQYHVAFIDYRGRISADGKETLIGSERRTAFVRRYLDSLGSEGWELVGIQPISPTTAYYVFKRLGHAAGEAGASQSSAGASSAESAAEPHPLGTL
jgi:hypothetical protein